MINCTLTFQNGKSKQITYNNDDFIDICDEFFGSIPRRLLAKNIIAVSWEPEEKDKKNIEKLIQGTITLNNGNKIDFITDNTQYEEAVADLKKKRELVFYNAMIKGSDVLECKIGK